MIYFDNAATGGFKPRTVTDTANTVTRFLCANPGRSGHRLSITGAEIVYNCRQELANMFGAKSDRVIFTKNCTEALNTAIFGTVIQGGHVITTVFEHNSVLRPLHYLASINKIELDVVYPTPNVSIEKAISQKIKPNTYLVATTSVSNVTGARLPVEKIGEICKSKSITYLVDGAQGGGHIPLNLYTQNISILCLAGHKGLLGTMGSGALIFDEKTDILPLMMGGTGSESFNLLQPENYPDRLEAGTLNLPAIASLYEGVNVVKQNLENYGEHLLEYTTKLIDGLNSINGIKCYSLANRSGIVAFLSRKIPSSELSDILSREYDIAVRGGLHCAPLLHKFMGTQNDGLVRASLSVQNSTREINYFLNAIKKIQGD